MEDSPIILLTSLSPGMCTISLASSPTDASRDPLVAKDVHEAVPSDNGRGLDVEYKLVK